MTTALDYCQTCGLKRCSGARGLACAHAHDRCGHVIHGGPCALARGHRDSRHMTAADIDADRERVKAYRRNRYATDPEWADRIRRNAAARNAA